MYKGTKEQIIFKGLQREPGTPGDTISSTPHIYTIHTTLTRGTTLLTDDIT